MRGANKKDKALQKLEFEQILVTPPTPLKDRTNIDLILDIIRERGSCIKQLELIEGYLKRKEGEENGRNWC
jgi:hypothetical protein